MHDPKCEEADDRHVEEIASQLEEIEQARVSADWANIREHDDRRIESNVGLEQMNQQRPVVLQRRCPWEKTAANTINKATTPLMPMNAVMWQHKIELSN